MSEEALPTYNQLSTTSLAGTIENSQIQIPSLIALAASTTTNSNSQATTPSDLLLESAADKSVIAQTLNLINNLQLELVNSENNNNPTNANNNSNNNSTTSTNFVKLENEHANSNSSSNSFNSNSNVDELNVLLESISSSVGSILADEILSFDLQTPNLLPNFFGHYLSETASRVLFLTVHWIKRIYIFQFLRFVIKG
jgi:hypothetical protein